MQIRGPITGWWSGPLDSSSAAGPSCHPVRSAGTGCAMHLLNIASYGMASTRGGPNRSGPAAIGASSAFPVRTLAERWNGRRWTLQPTPKLPGFNAELTSLSCPSSSDCTATGSDETIRWRLDLLVNNVGGPGPSGAVDELDPRNDSRSSA
jgi:hypothetical protein